MKVSSEAAQAAIDKIIKMYQDLADEEKAMAPRREAAQTKIDTLVDKLAAMQTFDKTKATSEMLGAYVLFERQVMMRMQMGDMSAQMKMAKFSESFISSLRDHFKSLQQTPEELMKVQTAARSMAADLAPSKIHVGMPTFDVAVSEPEGDFGKWTYAVVAVVIDENYKAKMVDKLDFDMQLTAQVTPYEGLTAEFNTPGRFYRAGQAYEPFVIEHETKQGGPEKLLHLQGHIYKGGRYVQPMEFPIIALAKQDAAPEFDMEALVRALQGGGGPGMG